MNTRWLEGTVAALALVLAPTTQARAGVAWTMGQASEDPPSGASGDSGEPAVATGQSVETIRGIVVSVSEGAGKASIRSGTSSFTLNGTPMDLLELRPGNHVSLTYREYGGVPWLLPSGTAGLGGGTGESGWLQTDNEVMATVGNVQRIDVPQGLVYLHDQAFHGHPAVIRRFKVGERITVLYQSFGGTPWITPV
ncbi:MAG: hypothetical protein HY901_34510 [Deltaproteobacteria bacterium]|nr:hypothetical protein [Deltaproteobacteria bacterium]